MLKLQLKVQGCTMNCIICSNNFLISFQVLSNKKSVIVLQSHFYWCITLSLSHFSFLSTKNFTEKKISLTDEILYIKLIPCIECQLFPPILLRVRLRLKTLLLIAFIHHFIILLFYVPIKYFSSTGVDAISISLTPFLKEFDLREKISSNCFWYLMTFTFSKEVSNFCTEVVAT